MKFENLKIDPELRDLLPPLTEEEYTQLEKNVLRDGKLIEPIWTWNGYIVDGHNRHKICKEHSIAVPDDYIITLAYETKEEIFQWMIDTQLGRRNLTPVQRIAIAEKYRAIFEAKARENLLTPTGGNNKLTLTNSSKSAIVNTRKQLADIASVSEDTYAKGTKILNSDDESLKQEVLSGKKTINKGYKELTGKVKGAIVEQDEESCCEKIYKCKLCGHEAEITDSDEDHVYIYCHICDKGGSHLKSEGRSSKLEAISSPTKVCKKCNVEKSNIEFYGDDKICKECVRKEGELNTPQKQTGSVFKDVTGAPLPYDKNDLDGVRAAIKEVRTEKIASECTTGENELVWTNFMCEDLIEQLDEHYFSLLKSSDKMDFTEKRKISEIIDTTINKLNGIKIKLMKENKE